MTTNLHLVFDGNCDAAFTFYETVFGTRRIMTMRYSDAPPGDYTIADDMKDRVMHTALPVGSMTLMGADAPPGRGGPFSAFDISLDDPDESKIKRLFAALSEGGSIAMPLAPTFWTPLFGMCQDRFGVDWMLSVPGPPSGN